MSSLDRDNMQALDAINVIVAFREGDFEAAGKIVDLHNKPDQLHGLIWQLGYNAGLLLALLERHGFKDVALTRMRELYLDDES
jgi:hypothetical protein